MSTETNTIFAEHAEENNLKVDDVMSAEESEFLAEQNALESEQELSDLQLAADKGALDEPN